MQSYRSDIFHFLAHDGKHFKQIGIDLGLVFFLLHWNSQDFETIRLLVCLPGFTLAAGLRRECISSGLWMWNMWHLALDIELWATK
jgi:hypothetical protein